MIDDALAHLSQYDLQFSFGETPSEARPPAVAEWQRHEWMYFVLMRTPILHPSLRHETLRIFEVLVFVRNDVMREYHVGLEQKICIVK